MNVQQRVAYSPEGEADDVHLYAADETLTNAIGERLKLHYPNHFWAVRTSHQQGVITVSLAGFMQWGFRVRIGELKADPGMTVVMRRAGAMLERLKMPRAGFDAQDYSNALRKYPTWLSRNRKPPV